MTRDEYVAQIVAAAPPLSPEVRAQLFVLLGPVRDALVATPAPSRRGDGRAA
jgi:hypothetical protein